MFVPVQRDFAQSILVAQFQTVPLRDPANARERQFGELFFPGVEHGHGLVAGNCEEQLEILPIGQCRQQWRLCRRFRPLWIPPILSPF